MAVSQAELRVVLSAVDNMSGTLTSAGGSFGVLGNAAKAAGIAVAAAGAATVAVGIQATRMAADFQSGMAEVATLFNPAESELKSLSQGVLDLSKSLGTDATGSTKALYQAISAGVPSENALTFLEVASKAAIGGVTTTETAVDGLTTVMNAFANQNVTVQQASDVMFATVKQGKTTFEELSHSMFNVAPLAAAAGVKFEEVSAAIATLTKSGVPTSVATTQIRAAMQGLLRPSDEMTKIFNNLGFESAEAGLKGLGLQKSLQAVREATGGSTGDMTKLLGSVEAVGAALGITGDKADMFEGDLAAITNSAGASTQAFEVMQGTFNRQLAVLTANINAAMIEVGTAILPVITPIVTALVKQLPGAIAATSAVLAPLGAAMVAAFTVGKDAFDAIVDVFQNNPLADALGSMATAATSVSDVFDTFVPDDLVAVFATARDASLSVADAFDELVPAINPVVEAARNLALIFRDTVIPVIATFAANARSGFTALAGVVRQALSGDVAGAIEAFLALVGTSTVRLVEQLLAWGQAFIDWVAPMIPGLLAAVGDVLAQLGAWITGVALPAIVAQLLVWGQAFVDWIAPYIGPMLAMLGDLLTQFGAWITGVALPAIVAQLMVWGDAFVTWITPYIGPMLAAAGDLLAQFGTWFTGTALPVIQAKLLEWGAAFLAWVEPQIEPFIAEVGKLLTRLGSWFTDTALPVIVQKLEEWGLAFIKWVVPMIPGMIVEVAKIQAAITTELARIAKELLAGAARNLGGSIVDGITNGIIGGGGPLNAAMKGLIDKAFGAGQNAADAQSPSQRAFDELGLPIAQGTALGIVAGTPMVAGAAANLVDTGFTSMAPAAAMKTGQTYAEALIKGLVDNFSGGSAAVGDAIRAVVETAIANNIDPIIAASLAKAESNFRPGALGDNNHSAGLFQLHDQGQGAGLGDSRFDPRVNAGHFLPQHAQQFQDLVGQGLSGANLAAVFGHAAEQNADASGAAYAAAFNEITAALGPMSAGLDTASAAHDTLTDASTTTAGAETALKTAGDAKTAMARTQGGVLGATAGAADTLAAANDSASSAEAAHASAVATLIAGLNSSADAQVGATSAASDAAQTIAEAGGTYREFTSASGGAAISQSEVQRILAETQQHFADQTQSVKEADGSYRELTSSSSGVATSQTEMERLLGETAITARDQAETLREADGTYREYSFASAGAAISQSEVARILAETATPAVRDQTTALSDATLKQQELARADALRAQQAAITAQLLRDGVTPAQLDHTAKLFDAAIKTGNLTEADRLLMLENQLHASILATVVTPAVIAQKDATLLAIQADQAWLKSLRELEIQMGLSESATRLTTGAVGDMTDADVDAFKASDELAKNSSEVLTPAFGGVYDSAEEVDRILKQTAGSSRGTRKDLDDLAKTNEASVKPAQAAASAYEKIGHVLNDVAKAAKDAAKGLQNVDGKLGETRGGDNLKGKALGGPVQSGTSYLVGERGPELFMPSRSGMIIPNNKLMSQDDASPSGGNTTVNVSVNGVGLDEVAGEVIRRINSLSMLGMLPQSGFSGVPR